MNEQEISTESGSIDRVRRISTARLRVFASSLLAAGAAAAVGFGFEGCSTRPGKSGSEAVQAAASAGEQQVRDFVAKAHEIARLSDLDADDWMPIDAPESDKATLREAHFDPGSFADGDCIVLAAAVRLARSLSASDVPILARFAETDDGGLLRSFAFMLLLREQWGDAANAMVRYTVMAPPENRYYAMWKWMSVVFGEHPDRVNIGRHFQLALLDCFEKGGQPEKLAIAALFGHGDIESMTNDLARFRAELDR